MRSDAGLAEKVRFLSGAGACEEGLPPRAVETHMSWVFLCSGRVLKLKKPVRYDFLDFSSLAARRFNCREEVRLNRRLAPDVYLGVAPLTQRSDGQFEVGPIDPMDAAAAAPTADPEGTADWLVVMRRLPAARMLDSALAAGTCTAADIDRLAERLAAFYRQTPVIALDGQGYLQRRAEAQRVDRAVLLDARFAEVSAQSALDRFDRAMRAHADALAERARTGRIRDGHGDLRPEHVALNATPIVIDCLEFNRTLREVDPFDELAQLDLECRLLGALWVGERLIARTAAALGDQPPGTVTALYLAGRALLRARLSVAHLLDPEPREPQRWLPQARRYLAQVHVALDRIGSN